MKKERVLLASVFLLTLSILLGLSSGVSAQPLPDLVVTKIECAPPQSKLAFTVMNRSNVPLPKGWRAVADVYFDGVKKGFFDLGRPAKGDITPAGGSAYYLVVFDIVAPVNVRVVADAINSTRESNEGNNSMTARVNPCGGKPDLVVERIWGEFNPHAHDAMGHKHYFIYFNIKNIGGIEFVGTLTINASVSPAPRPYPYIRTTYEGRHLIGNPLVIPGFRLSPDAILRFDLEGPDAEWIGSSYDCTVRLSTDNPSEVSANNEKSERLTLPRR